MERLKEISDEYAETLDSDGDWEPTLMIVKDGEAHVAAFPMPPNGVLRERLFMTVLPNLIHEKFPNPDAVIILISAWYLDLKENGEWSEGDPLPSESPDRKEGLVVQGISSEKELSLMAEIKRSESSPKLEWIPDIEGAAVEGRLVGCLRRAVWT